MDEKGGGGGDGKNDSDDSRSTIAQHCQNGQTLSTINTNFLHSSSTRGDDDAAAAEESSQDRGVQHKQQQQELVPERGQACSSNDQDGAAYDVQDETQRIEPIKLSNGQYGSGGGGGGDDQSKNGSLTGDTAEDGRPKGHLRKLCEESNQPLQEAIQSLEQLNRRIDAFRQSPIWQQCPAIREEYVLLRTPSSVVSSSLSESPLSPEDDRLRQGVVEAARDRNSDSGIGVDDCSSVTVAGSCSSTSPLSTEEDKAVGTSVREKKVETKKKITFESGVQMIQDLLLDTQRQCVKMVNENQRTASRFDDELGRCQNQMDVLRKELAYAHRCVNDLEVNMMINGSATESDTELQNAEHEMEAEIYRLREDNSRLRAQFRALQRELLLERQEAAAAAASAAAVNANAMNGNSVLAGGACSTNSDSFPRASAAGALVAVQQQIASIQAAVNQASPHHSNNSLNARCSSSSENNNGNNNKGVDEDGNKATSMSGQESASFANLQLELVHAREALIALKHDRKRLKAEKVELLNQMKEVYQTLEAKERELRDFIRQFEQKMRESDKGIKELIWEKEKLEKDKRQLSEALEKANEKSDQAKVDLEKEKAENQKLHAQLKELQGRFVLITGQQPQLHPSSTDLASVPTGVNGNSRSALPGTTPGSLGYVSLPVSPMITDATATSDKSQVPTHMPKFDPSDTVFTPEEAALLRRGRQKPSPDVTKAQENRRTTSKFLSQVCDCPTTYYEDTGGATSPAQSTQQHLALLRRGRASGRKNQDSPKGDSTPGGQQERSASSTATSGGGGAANRLSRLFHFSHGGRSKSKDDQHSKQKEIDAADRSSSALAVDAIAADLNLVEKADQLLQARQIPMARWRQSHVVAWLELELGMYAYSSKFVDNVKSGKVLLSLTDHEIEHVLGITSALHKKKFRLAIEEYRAPALCKFPAIKEVTNQYVCRQWLPSIGMPQYTHSFRHHLIDGRLLNYLNKKQLDKYLGVSRRFHQLSILKGIELLRLFNFDIKALSKRRLECERDNVDLLVWTNGRLGKWCEQIDLGEYADNLRESGLHGGLCVLDPSFTIDTLATALGIPSGRTMVRKHLTAEFLPLLNQARAHLENYQSHAKSHGNRSGGSLGRAFSRSYTISGDQEFTASTPPADPKQQRLSCKRRRGLRGSIGRVFGLRVRRSTATIDDQFAPDELSPARSATMANMGMHSGALLDARVPSNGSTHDLHPPQNTSTPANVSSPKPLNRSTGTLSSTTSDLGSSIERSQHMKTILGTPKVLTQPPLTSMTSSTSKGNVASAGTSTGGILKSSISDAADLSRLQHLCLSPGEVLTSGGGAASSRNPLVRLRNKARYGGSDVPKMGIGGVAGGLVDVASTRSPGSTPARPHSVGDFGGLAAFYYSANSGNNYQSFGGQPGQGQKSGAPWWKPNGIQAKNNDVMAENFVSFSPQRLQTWLSAEHFAMTPAPTKDAVQASHFGQNGDDHPQQQQQQQQQQQVNGHSNQAQQYAMGTISEQGEPVDSENDTIPRDSARKSSNKSFQAGTPMSPPDTAFSSGQSHYYRQHSKTPRMEPSPSRSSSSSLSPSRKDRPRSLPLKTASTNTDLHVASNRQNRHRDSATSSASSKCEECIKIGEARANGGENVKRQKSVPPLASTDSIHETDL